MSQHSNPSTFAVRSRKALSLTIAWLLATGQTATAETFRLPDPGDDLIGEIRHTRAHQEDTLIDIARRFSVGQDEMVMANQNVDRWLPKAGTDVLIPQEYILPDAPRAGIVVNIPEMRLYYFPVKAAAPAPRPATKKVAATKPVAGKPAAVKPGAAKPGAKAVPGKGPAKPVAAVPKPAPAPAAVAPAFESSQTGEVITYPVSMGRMDWRTPIGKTSVVNKQKDPSWTPPASIKREHAAKGDPLPDVVPPGPDNPLGKFAMRLGVSGYLIHGTDAAKADGIGMRVTHGCMRLYNEDIAKLFPLVPVGAPVYLVNQPIKLGWKDGKLYLEASQPLDEDVGIAPHDVDDDVSKAQLAREDAQRSRYLMRIAMTEVEKQRDKTGASIDMDKVRRAVERPTGIPVVIGGTGSDWQRAAASGVGLAPAPVAKDDDPNAAALATKPLSPARSSAPVSPAAPRYRGTPADDAYLRSRTAPDDESGASSEELYSPANPYRPGSDTETAETDAPRPARAKTMPYGSESPPEASDLSEPEEE